MLLDTGVLISSVVVYIIWAVILVKMKGERKPRKGTAYWILTLIVALVCLIWLMSLFFIFTGSELLYDGMHYHPALYTIHNMNVARMLALISMLAYLVLTGIKLKVTRQ